MFTRCGIQINRGHADFASPETNLKLKGNLKACIFPQN